MRAPLAVAILTIVGLPVLAYAAFPPARRLLPSLAGVACVGRICTDRPEQRHEAERLYSDAVQFVHEKIGAINNPPQIIFCRLNSCASYFGLTKSKAQTTGPFGTVIGPEGWLPFIVRHELIHQLQNERLGKYRLRSGPDWFIESMAHSMSDDPRSDLGDRGKSTGTGSTDGTQLRRRINCGRKQRKFGDAYPTAQPEANLLGRRELHSRTD